MTNDSTFFLILQTARWLLLLTLTYYYVRRKNITLHLIALHSPQVAF